MGRKIFPAPLKRVISVLDDEDRQAIIMYLIEQKRATIHEISASTGLPVEIVKNHLNELIKGNLVSQKIYRGTPVYEVTRNTIDLVFYLFSWLVGKDNERSRKEDLF